MFPLVAFATAVSLHVILARNLHLSTCIKRIDSFRWGVTVHIMQAPVALELKRHIICSMNEDGGGGRVSWCTNGTAFFLFLSPATKIQSKHSVDTSICQHIYLSRNIPPVFFDDKSPPALGSAKHKGGLVWLGRDLGVVGRWVGGLL